MFDVAIVGAGISGLVCAQRLRQMGLDVVVIEKSRGLGGRMATRRLPGTWADHGVRCLENQGEFSQAIARTLLERKVLHLWTETVYEPEAEHSLQPSAKRHPRYAAAEGITAIAKFLAGGLEIRRGQRVQAIAPIKQAWVLTLPEDSAATPLQAGSIVLAVPAPQALALLEPIADAALLAAVRSVEFNACITAIATYAPEYQSKLAEVPWRAIAFDSSDLAWVGLESSKQGDSRPAVVVQSSAGFADRHLEAPDLNQIGQDLLVSAAHWLPGLDRPELLQVHRWRYAFASRSLAELCLSAAEPLPWVCTGDWCGGSQIEDALRSGWAAADRTAAQMGLDHAEVKDFAELLRSL